MLGKDPFEPQTKTYGYIEKRGEDMDDWFTGGVAPSYVPFLCKIGLHKRAHIHIILRENDRICLECVPCVRCGKIDP